MIYKQKQMGETARQRGDSLNNRPPQSVGHTQENASDSALRLGMVLLREADRRRFEDALSAVSTGLVRGAENGTLQ
jgi:hypothetical protein